MNSSKLIFLDESGVNTGMTRIYGREIEGKRVVDYVPDNRFSRTSIVSSVRMDGKCVPMVFQGALDGDIFKSYLEKLLLPTIIKGDIVIMDNLSSHKVKGIDKIIESAGAKIVYLPPYSPDLNPIEMMWSKIKSYLRKIKARTNETLFDAISEAFSTIEISDILGWFREAGYSV